jgi:hypothetical protein
MLHDRVLGRIPSAVPDANSHHQSECAATLRTHPLGEEISFSGVDFPESSGEASFDTDTQEKRNEERNRQPPKNPVKWSRHRIHGEILRMRRRHIPRLRLFFVC